MNCSECGKSVNLDTVKYFTADHKNVFCDAYCSFYWHDKRRNVKPKAGDIIELRKLKQ